MSDQKKKIRSEFRNKVFHRDGYKCVCCDFQSTPNKAEHELDCHHICDRNEIINGGYVQENGISLCSKCHELAEEYHSIGISHPGFSPDDLYNKIGSSYERAVAAASSS